MTFFQMVYKSPIINKIIMTRTALNDICNLDSY